MKNLNACGDGGLLTTDDQGINQYVRSIRNHGLLNRNTVEQFGYVSRMDTIQATILNHRLDNLDNVIRKRRDNAEMYLNLLHNLPIQLPLENETEYNSYHTFVIQIDQRDILKDFLNNNNIETGIHYPIPIHLQPAAKYLKYKNGCLPNTEKQAKKILTLPINQYLKNSEINKVINKIKEFYKIY